MVDISIKHLNSMPKKKQQEVILSAVPVTIFEKFDGTKLNIIRNFSKYDERFPEMNWIVSYKGHRIYREEIEYLRQSEEVIKLNSIGFAQYTLVWNYLIENHKDFKDIHEGTVFFLEFIQNKPTITRDYTKKHLLIRVGYSQTLIDLTKPGFVETWDSELFWNYPYNVGHPNPVLFSGHPIFLPSVNDYETFKDYFLSRESLLGGKMEGIVIHYKDELYKVVQDDQYSKELRQSKKDRYRMSMEEEHIYWDKIRVQSDMLLEDIYHDYLDIKTMLSNASRTVFGLTIHAIEKATGVHIYHDKKSVLQIKEDLYLSLRIKIIDEINARLKD